MSFHMTNRKWVILHILWEAVSSILFTWLTACEWHCTCCERQSHPIPFAMTKRKWVTLHIFWKAVSSLLSYDQQKVSDIAHFVKGNLIASFPMTNREWVTLHTLWRAVSSHHFLWPTVCEWHWKFCERQPHHIFSYDQQEVSDIAHFVKGGLITASFSMINSEWVTLHILWKTVSSHIFLWPT